MKKIFKYIDWNMIDWTCMITSLICSISLIFDPGANSEFAWICCSIWIIKSMVTTYMLNTAKANN